MPCGYDFKHLSSWNSLTSDKFKWHMRPKLFLLLLISFYFYGSSLAEELNDYRFAPDDQISITVFGEPDLSQPKVRIPSNGSISIPLIGQVHIQNLTTAEVENKLTQLLADGYLKKPAITVSIVEYRLFYINGEVKNPGGYSYRDGLTIERAVALAGGFSERASKNNITITRDKDSAKTNKVQLNTPIKPGDVITVKESFF